MAENLSNIESSEDGQESINSNDDPDFIIADNQINFKLMKQYN